ncbi:hypothetical protein LZ30DRAFT_722394 [Colletotrichum cereale]|nr:hypothetical protein LZ30DRAFT_722394 [Colletotrichum cereale]
MLLKFKSLFVCSYLLTQALRYRYCNPDMCTYMARVGELPPDHAKQREALFFRPEKNMPVFPWGIYRQRQTNSDKIPPFQILGKRIIMGSSKSGRPERGTKRGEQQ